MVIYFLILSSRIWKVVLSESYVFCQRKPGFMDSESEAILRVGTQYQLFIVINFSRKILLAVIMPFYLLAISVYSLKHEEVNLMARSEEQGTFFLLGNYLYEVMSPSGPEFSSDN